MEITVGKTAGFCYGVKRAVEGAEKQLKENQEQVYCLGEIVHNKEVIQSLQQKGIQFVDEVEEAKGKTIIRAHGIPEETRVKAKKLGIELIDYTCPNVLKIHEIAKEYANEEYYIFLLGSPNHPENIGTISYCGKNYQVIEKEEEIEQAIQNFQDSKKDKLLIIEQTTYSLEKFEKIVEQIKLQLDINTKLVIKNTICAATKLRQKETEEIAKKVEYMIIIGGKNSSNTKKWYEIAKQYCENTICVENQEQLLIEEVQKFQKIGIMAGASTPQISIQEIINIIKNKEEVLI